PAADSLECEGRSLLKSFVTSAALRGEDVHVFTFELSETEFSIGLDDGVRTRLHFHDGFSDPLEWERTGTFAIRSLSAQELIGRVGAVQRTSQRPCTVVLDSLSSILQHKPIDFLCRTLQGFQRGAVREGLTVRRLLALLHADLHQPELPEALAQLGTTVITVTPSPEGTWSRESSLTPNVASIVHKRKSGKVLQQVEPDPAANLPFNLRLTEEEREARKQVPLPYHFSTEKKMSLLHGGPGDSRIYYQPDDADDVDEEDPDDDLDF
ncbi:elongator complex protein 5, partial [Rhincodon typus]|uniref:elongator complex protein 5 n=1 Tax=Rhincodon typus TaxID=259920 RepID=UPI00202E4A80